MLDPTAGSLTCEEAQPFGSEALMVLPWHITANLPTMKNLQNT